MIDPINSVLLLCLIAGYCQLLAAAINRLHSLRYHGRVLKRWRFWHDVVLVTVPAVAVSEVGIGGPGLLFGGSWATVPWGWQAFAVVCLPGVFWLLTASARNLFRPRPYVWNGGRSEVIDIARRLGCRPVGAGNGPWSTRIPGNEVFQLEVNEKEFRLPGLPVECDGLSIVHLSDMHFMGVPDKSYFEEVCRIAQDMQGDLVVFTGDLIDGQALLSWVPDTLGRLSAPLGQYFVLGNHDWYQPLTASIRRAMCDAGWLDVAGRTMRVSYRGGTLEIGGSEVPWMGQHPPFRSNGEDDFRLLLSHTPDNIDWARSKSVHLMLSGHNHGGQVRLPVIGPVYSPSAYGVRYASGVFFEPPTLLHVSRGIAGELPVRFNCRPELTKLILRPVLAAARNAEAKSVAQPALVAAAAS